MGKTCSPESIPGIVVLFLGNNFHPLDSENHIAFYIFQCILDTTNTKPNWYLTIANVQDMMAPILDNNPSTGLNNFCGCQAY